MGFGTQQQLGNRTGITNQTTLADIFSGGNMNPQPPTFGGGNMTPPGQGGQNPLFALLQSLLSGQGGFQQAPGQQLLGEMTRQPPVGIAPPPGKSFGNITPIGLGQSLNVQPGNFPGTPMTQLSNPFGNLINQRAIR